MAGYRENFIRLAAPAAVLFPLKSLIRLTGQRLLVPLYHIVSDDPPAHVRHLYPVQNTRSFIKSLDLLLKNYKPVSYPELEALLKEKRSIKKNIFLLSFDDGLREFYDIIAPLLLKKGVPAVCFLNSSFTNNKDLFYRYKASLLIDCISKNKNTDTPPGLKEWMVQHNCNSTADLTNFIKAVHYRNRSLLDEFAGLLNVDFSDFLQTAKPYMTHEQISSLKEQGFHFGAHSADHPEYFRLSLQQQLEQTETSMRLISSEFHLPYKCFAFPFTDHGVSKAFFEEMFSRQIATVSFGTAGIVKENFPMHVQRVPLERGNLTAKQIIHAEYLYFILKSMTGRNKIIRK